MIPSRRAVLAGLAAAAATPDALRASTTALPIAARPIVRFAEGSPERALFGSLRFRSGLVLSSADPFFGGLSALWRSPDGRGLLAVTDRGRWLTADVATRDGALAGLDRAATAPILGADGRPLAEGRASDTESLAMADGIAFVASERTNEVRRFAFGRDGVSARGTPIAMPAETKALPRNAGFEALALAPSGGPLAGALLAIAEQSAAGAETPTAGWVLTGPDRFAFAVSRSGDYAVTDAVFQPDGSLLVLERRFGLFAGFGARIRRIARETIRPGAVLDGPAIFEAGPAETIDNMEAISLHADPATGGTVVTLLSDDNFLPFQRNLMLEFDLVG